jgi:hypothetical protein
MNLAILGRQRKSRAATLFAAMTSAVILASTGAADAAICADTDVSAKGEVASFKWLALVKARGNWRAKVRTIPKLGSEYANYGRAEGQVERCISDQRTTVCTVTARPCKP